MTVLLKSIRGKININCLAKGKLNKDGCKVVMTDMPASRVVVDFDKPGSPLATDTTRCDYLLVAEDKQHACRWVAVLELKRGQLRADQVVRQLRAGASAAANLVPPGEAFRFRPVAACGSFPKYERQRLKDRSNIIVLHGEKGARPIDVVWRQAGHGTLLMNTGW